MTGDVRQGGAWSRGQRWKNDALYLAIRAALAALVPLPRAWLRVIGRGVGLVAWLLLGRARRTARANLAVAFPAATAHARGAILARTYVTLGAHLGDAIAALDVGRPLEALAIDEADLALLRCPRGVLFASAHLGPWERVAATLVARGVPMTAVARESYDPRLDAIYARLRDARGVRVLYRGREGAASRIVRTLRAGGVLGVPMDLRSRVPSIEAPFLGVPAPTPIGPARIALRTGARVVVGTVAPDPRAASGSGSGPGPGLRITCTEIPTADLPRSVAHGPARARHDDVAARVLTERINAALSERIRALPTEWPWMHERFAALPGPLPSHPANGAALYDPREPNPVH